VRAGQRKKRKSGMPEMKPNLRRREKSGLAESNPESVSRAGGGAAEDMWLRILDERFVVLEKQKMED
jgi:hypothetical protein